MNARHKREIELNSELRPSPERPQRRSAVERVARAIGNRGFGSMLGRLGEGDGILAGGVVHRDVEAAIRASQGRGQPLERRVRDTLEKRLGAPLDDVRVHVDDQADTLARSVSARAFTVGSDIYFSRDEYQAGQAKPSGLLAHEVTHVLQQRGAALTGPLTVTRPNDPTELEAEAVARDIGG